MLVRWLHRGAAALLGYTALLAVIRRWHRRWGATDAELRRPLPGDEHAHRLAATHAITIDAPAGAVWPWLVQIGQDRGGFYSYTVLENLVLADIHNADRIHPEWQELRVGDTVRLASERLYGDRPLLRVVALEPERHLVLEGWGSFVLEPVDDQTTRMIIRTHAAKLGFVGRVLDFYVLEPAHFIMERGMLRGIKARAERSHRSEA